MKYLSFLLFFLFFPVLPANAEDCIFTAGGTNTVMINAGTLMLPSDLSVGGTIFKQDYLYDSITAHQGIRCGSDGHFSFNYVTNMINSVSSLGNTYNTNIPGVGIKISMYSDQDYWNFPTSPTAAPFNIPITVDSNAGSTANFGSGYQHIVIELVKIASTISAGNLIYSVPDFASANSSNTLKIASLDVSANITVSSCSINAQTPTFIDLGTTSKNAIPNIGSTSNKKNFSLVLDCTGTSNVNLAVSGTEDAHALGMGVIAPDASSTATGVGVQILFMDTPVTFNQVFSVGTASSGQFTIPMSAKIYRTESNMTPGQFNSNMTYTLTYL